MKNNEINSTYIFRSGKEPFLSIAILPFVVLVLGAVVELYIETYIRYFQYVYVLLIITILFIAYIMTYPSYFKYLYYRWIVFRYNRTTTFSIDMEQKLLTYKHDEEVITFASDDVEKWSWGYYKRMNTTFVEIVRIRLKNGKIIEISSGIGDVEKFLQENWQQLGIPKGTYRYGDDYKSLQSYMKRINH